MHFFEFVPLLMLIFAFLGKLPNGLKWICVVFMLLLFAQYATAHIPVIAAVHPGVDFFWNAIILSKQLPMPPRSFR
ncbi:DUF6220 domain-containing protein [Brevibacillus invocatus]|nr:DUF6220 domain-containing protein [Brevibacillus invocatus]MCM3432502.1 DUF6220 domain-containing protein [Brevibacillus invocatus]